MLYSHNDTNNNNKYKYKRWEWVYFFLSPVLGDTRGETQIIKAYANYIILTPPPPPPCTAHLVMSKISTNLCRLRLKLICFDQIPKTQPRASTVEPQLLVFSKSSNSQGHLFRVRRQPSTQFPSAVIKPHVMSGGLLWQMMIVISFSRGRKSAPSDNAPELRDTE